MRVAIYLRVSTADQTTDNHLCDESLEAVRKAPQLVPVVRVFEDSGISGAKGRDDALVSTRCMKGVSRRDFDMVLAWWVDRLGRSLTGLA